MTTPGDWIHLHSWADTHEGYTVKVRQAVVRCLWCDYVAIAGTAREAVAIYKKQHEQPILDRELAGRQAKAGITTEQELAP